MLTAQLLLVALQSTPDTAPASSIAPLIVLAIGGITIASLWRVYQRAGEPGWATLVPIYNAVVLLRVARRPIWWIVLLLVPLVNLVTLVAIDIALARRFGRSAGFGVAIALLPFVFLPVLAFASDAEPSPA